MFPKAEFHPILFEEVYIKDALGQDVTQKTLNYPLTINYRKMLRW